MHFARKVFDFEIRFVDTRTQANSKAHTDANTHFHVDVASTNAALFNMIVKESSSIVFSWKP